MNRSYIIDPAGYPWVATLRSDWAMIKKEYDDFCTHVAEYGFNTRTIEVRFDELGVYKFFSEVDPTSIIVKDVLSGLTVDVEFHTVTTLEPDSPIPIERTVNYIKSDSHKNSLVSLRYSYAVLVPFKEKIYDGIWIPIGIVRYGAVNRLIADFFPRTLALLRSITGLESAMYSILAPGTVIHPHCGYSADIYRLHLGLTPYQDAVLRVGDQLLTWDEGSVFIFDDMEMHEVWHRGENLRISFIVDFRRDPAATAHYPEFIEQRRATNKLADLLAGKLK